MAPKSHTSNYQCWGLAHLVPEPEATSRPAPENRECHPPTALRTRFWMTSMFATSRENRETGEYSWRIPWKQTVDWLRSCQHSLEPSVRMRSDEMNLNCRTKMVCSVGESSEPSQPFRHTSASPPSRLSSAICSAVRIPVHSNLAISRDCCISCPTNTKDATIAAIPTSSIMNFQLVLFIQSQVPGFHLRKIYLVHVHFRSIINSNDLDSGATTFGQKQPLRAADS